MGRGEPEERGMCEWSRKRQDTRRMVCVVGFSARGPSPVLVFTRGPVPTTRPEKDYCGCGRVPFLQQVVCGTLYVNPARTFSWTSLVFSCSLTMLPGLRGSL